MSGVGIEIVGGARRTIDTEWLWVAPTSRSGTDSRPIGMWIQNVDRDLALHDWVVVLDTSTLKVRVKRVQGIDHYQLYIHESLLDE